MTSHRIVFGDSRRLNHIEDQSVQLVVTSPPYWQLKDYGSDQQIGFHDDYSTYINDLNLVWKECYRVLSDGCRLCINIGDQFARGVFYGRYKVIPIRTEIIRFCESIGMDYMGAIIWQKTTTMNTTGGGAVMGSFPYPRNGILKIDYEFILIFKKLGNAPKPTVLQKKQSEMSREEWNQFFSSHWYFNGVRQEGHVAMFPEELPHRLIKMFSFVGETVLDPFLGSGTTSLAAQKLGRNSIGYEINPNLKPIIIDKMNANQVSMSNDLVTFEVDKDPLDYTYESLPYQFSDPHKMNKKVDVKKFHFGSKFDDSSQPKTESYRVSDVLSPEIVLLNNGLKVRLIGIKPILDHVDEAVKYLKNKTKGTNVTLRFDSQKHDDDNTVLAYMYLANKTFVNLHLIRTGFVDVETKYPFSQIKKFDDAKRNLRLSSY